MATDSTPPRKNVVFLRGEIKSPPFTVEGRHEAGSLLRWLQEGELLGMPYALPLPTVGPRCLELRVRDAGHLWRIVCRTDADAILVANIFAKTGKAMQQREFAKATKTLKDYDNAKK
jgi:phage-related protein